MNVPRIIDAPLPDGVLGFTDGTSTIWLDWRLTAAGRRVALDHELTHYVRGHTGHCEERVEGEIDRGVARGLISVRDLGEAAAWSPYPSVIAEELDVLPETVVDRIRALSGGERMALARRLAEAHWMN